jgi:hypothetical protein
MEEESRTMNLTEKRKKQLERRADCLTETLSLEELEYLAHLLFETVEEATSPGRTFCVPWPARETETKTEPPDRAATSG